MKNRAVPLRGTYLGRVGLETVETRDSRVSAKTCLSLRSLIRAAFLTLARALAARRLSHRAQSNAYCPASLCTREERAHTD